MAISDYQIGQEIYTETKLESYILNHLQSFLLEMGRGFCFEARQKRILIDQDYFKADLIFYHRILICGCMWTNGRRTVPSNVCCDWWKRIRMPWRST